MSPSFSPGNVTNTIDVKITNNKHRPDNMTEVACSCVVDSEDDWNPSSCRLLSRKECS